MVNVSGFRRTDSYGDVARLSFLDKRLVCNMNKAPDIESVCTELDRSIRGPKKPDVKLVPSCSRRSSRPLSKTMPRVSITLDVYQHQRHLDQFLLLERIAWNKITILPFNNIFFSLKWYIKRLFTFFFFFFNNFLKLPR